ncbi:YycH family regulatory protein [Priestia flexa]|jgi:regulatory protein YycH of two-component signal transduction system YycFG|uniref:Regulatory protein YycH domain-containing protein n=1 Tax=Priestia flexa TaxID=86664 RepID=A0A8I1MJG7_9BACI|nr:two-component system activity regulator YycH [Priestia flexa]MBN8253450.1 hypothetical protein [Priestia flexa]MBN8433455.1 hypothetical protein [Priestia flexa]MCA0966288.1 YycH family regulatory protein [Priestia flexa]RIV12854.1 hypothetical protein D1859_04790 [Priestia flexa]
MGMRYENIKTIVLVILVVLSLFLTWNLWSYQSPSDLNTETQNLQEAEVGGKSELEDYIRPTKVLYHQSGSHYLSHEEKRIDSWLQEMRTWKLGDITDVSSAIEPSGFLNYVHDNNSVEIVYPDLIPVETFQQMFSFTTDKLPRVDFDRVVIKIKKTPNLSVNMYLVNYSQQKVYAVKISNVVKNDVQKLADAGTSAERCLVYKKNENRYIFIPAQTPDMHKLYAYEAPLDIRKFQNALFTNPSYARTESLAYRELYTEGTKVINVNTRTNVMEYVNLVNSNTESNDDANLLNRSFSFVNDHAGWTEPDYRFDSWNRVTKEITYRYYHDNHPVYSNQGMTEIYQRWGNAEVLNYRRPLYRFVQVSLPEMKVQLQSPQEVIEMIEKHQDFDPSLLNDISIGYQLEEGIGDNQQQDTDKTEYDSNSVTLVPSWFYYYNNKWYRVTLPDEGGVNGGLE